MRRPRLGHLSARALDAPAAAPGADGPALEMGHCQAAPGPDRVHEYAAIVLNQEPAEASGPHMPISTANAPLQPSPEVHCKEDFRVDQNSASLTRGLSGTSARSRASNRPPQLFTATVGRGGSPSRCSSTSSARPDDVRRRRQGRRWADCCGVCDKDVDATLQASAQLPSLKTLEPAVCAGGPTTTLRAAKRRSRARLSRKLVPRSMLQSARGVRAVSPADGLCSAFLRWRWACGP